MMSTRARQLRLFTRHKRSSSVEPRVNNDSPATAAVPTPHSPKANGEQTQFSSRGSFRRANASFLRSLLADRFAGLPAFRRRKRNKIKVPSMDFTGLHSEFLLELGYMANLLRQSIRLDNRDHLVAQLIECARLVRGRVASGAACIQPVPKKNAEGHCSLDNAFCYRNREVMQILSHFHDTYLSFVDWLTELSKITLTKPPLPCVDNLKDRLIPKPLVEMAPEVERLRTRGQEIFRDLRSAGLAVFDALKASGYTTLVDPDQLEKFVRGNNTPVCVESLNGSKQPVVSSPADRRSITLDSSTADSKCSHGVLTEADRLLLTKLWSQLDAIGGPHESRLPPPKPPILSNHGQSEVSSDNGFISDSNESHSSGGSRRSSQHHPHPFDDPEFSAYLQELASVIQIGTSQANQNQPGSVTKRPPLPPKITCKNSGIDLNALDQLDFPLADASEESDSEVVACAINTIPRAASPRAVRYGDVSNLSDLYRLHPQDEVVSRWRTDRTEPCETTHSGHRTSTISPREHCEKQAKPSLPNKPEKPPLSSTPKWSYIPGPSDPFNPLDDRCMEENIAAVAMRIQNSEPKNERTSCRTDSQLSDRISFVIPDGNTTADRELVRSLSSPADEVDGAVTTDPVCYSETKEDTQDDSELIEANGKKYRRYFQRHIKIERHKIRQVVVAPSLPDGTGPDLSRAVYTANANSAPTHGKSPGSIGTRSIDSVDSLHDPDPHVPSGLNSNSSSFEADVKKSPLKCSPTPEPIAGLQETATPSVNIAAPDGTEIVDDLDWDSDDQSTEPEVVLPTPPPKPPPPQAIVLRNGKKPLAHYMFRFGSSDYSDPDIDRRLSTQLIDFFRAHWYKEESAEGPHQRSKTISYVQSYAQQTPVGDVVHRSTCVQQTCTVRMVGGLEGLKAQQRSAGDTSLMRHETPEFTELPSDKPSGSTDSTSDKERLKTQPPPVPLIKLRTDVGLSTVPTSDLSSTQKPSTLIDSFSTLQPRTTGSATPSILSLVKADDYLIWGNSDAPNEICVYAGCIDALVVYLTSFGKLSPAFYLYFETFLFTYRSFMTPEDLVQRLIKRYVHFREPVGDEEKDIVDDHSLSSSIRAKVCSSTASILVTVVSRLKQDLTPSIRSQLDEFEKMLIDDNYSSLGRLLNLTVQRQVVIEEPDTEQSESLVSNSDDLLKPKQTHERSYSTGEVDMSVLVNTLRLGDLRDRNGSLAQSTELLSAGNLTLPKARGNSLANALNAARRSLIETNLSESNGSSVLSELLSPMSLSPRNLRRKSFSPAVNNQPSLLSFQAKDLAEQLTYLEAQKYNRITLSEVLDVDGLEKGKAVNVSACAAHFSAVSNWATFQILNAPSSERDRIASRLLDVMEHLHKLQNFSSYLSLLCSFLLIPESLLSRRTRAHLCRVKPYMQPPQFSEYRRELEAATPPFIPYLGLMMQNLIVLAQSNPLFYHTPPEQLKSVYRPEHGPVVNFWRCWKHFLIIHFIVKREKTDPERTRYAIKPNKKVLAFLNDFKDSLPEPELRLLANRLRRGAT
ncbi:unnamed protein product [Calicophoron daubneyi]|uniref:Uncharacterized protein n=1 Tax=Calicophoron daubneyi TaxID=300641 RepID=A0AAV2U0K7_CALDB